MSRGAPPWGLELECVKGFLLGSWALPVSISYDCHYDHCDCWPASPWWPHVEWAEARFWDAHSSSSSAARHASSWKRLAQQSPWPPCGSHPPANNGCLRSQPRPPLSPGNAGDCRQCSFHPEATWGGERQTGLSAQHGHLPPCPPSLWCSQEAPASIRRH